MEARIYSVYDVNRYIKNLFLNDFLLSKLKIKGEISNLKYHSSGHVYLTLKDENAAINCVMFKSNADKLDFRFEEGQKVVFTGSLSVYEKTGQYQMYVQKAEKFGVGDLYEAFLKLKAKFEKEGLFEIKKGIPSNINKVAVLTSDTGAAIRDIINVIRRRNKSIDIVVVPTLVQGTGSKENIVENIKKINRYKNVDVIILGRGGGSIEDLWSFNEEEVAMAILDSKIPIVSAVGHETDFTIADFISNIRAATPSEAAELVSKPLNQMVYELENKIGKISKIIETKVKIDKEKVNSIRQSYIFKKPEELFNTKKQELDFLFYRLDELVNKKIDNSKNELEKLFNKLDGASPTKILKRGYAIAKKDNKQVRNKADLSVGDNINITFIDGEVLASIREV